ncbi:MAG: ABC transporter ATP-binding protein [Candidatus Rokubacteria bacterium]|nr:ABC transporter ATP-binding protein [Candidatus Rokubacteria bacterium]
MIRSEDSSGTLDVLVRFVDVQKTFDGETLVIENLNLEIYRGEFLTLLGPSGSGKTTTLIILAGFEVPTHGDILLAGRSLRNVPPHKRAIGLVFQNYALFPHMTVEENLAFPLLARRRPRAEIAGRIARALDMVQLGGFGKRRPAQLSGGQQQRVALARALVFEPTLVLMDEPLGALDKQLREQMQLEIKHIHERLGVTAVYVTHDQSEALTMSDRIAVLNKGAIQQVADPQTLYEEPRSSFVAEFIGENNRLAGRAVSITGKECTVELDAGGLVQALAVNVVSVGSPTLLSLRPERVIISPDTGHCRNRFPARVEEIIYQGDHLRVRATVCGRDDFMIKIPRSADGPPIARGQTLTVGWNPRDCRALDAP